MIVVVTDEDVRADIDQVRYGLVELGASLDCAAFNRSDLACTADDRLCREVAVLAGKINRRFIELPALASPGGVASLWAQECGGQCFMLVLTTGQNYAAAELIRRARGRGWIVGERVLPWRQLELL